MTADDAQPTSGAGGYAHPAYAASLCAYGTPVELPACGGCLLRRAVPGHEAADAMGPYPLFSCTRWDGLGEDLEALAAAGDLVSTVLVLNPFAPVDAERLAALFPDACRVLKEHHIVDLGEKPETFIDRHHRRNARWAAQRAEVERLGAPQQFLESWVSLYDNLIARHEIRGMARFGRECFARQFAVPGLVAFRAAVEGETAGMALWYREGETAFYHLAAYNEAGYAAKASFAIFREALAFFRREGVSRLDLGGGAGARADADDGLNRFKRGWATGTLPARLCGRVLDAGAYARLAENRTTDYFPAYREGEFA